MANSYTNTGTIGGQGSHLMPPYYTDFLRANLFPSLYWRQCGSLITIPRGHGTKARVPKWRTVIQVTNGQAVISGATSSIQNFDQAGGTTVIDTKTMSADSITGEVTGWAGAKGYNDRMVIVNMASFTEAALIELSRELAFKIDRYGRRKTSGNAYKVQARTKAGAATATNKVSGTATLHSKNIALIKPIMLSHMLPQWGDGTFVGIAHPLAQYDIMQDSSATGFVPVASYNNARMVFRGEIGEMYGIRWLLTNSIPRFADSTASATTGLSGGVTGSNAYIFSPNAFYNLELETGGVEVVHQPLGSGGATGDPVGHLGSIGVKVNYGIIATPSAERRIVRLVHATTINL